MGIKELKNPRNTLPSVEQNLRKKETRISSTGCNKFPSSDFTKSSRGRLGDPCGRSGAFCDFVNAPKTMADKIRAVMVRLQREHTTAFRPRICRKKFLFSFNFPYHFTSEPPASARLTCSWHSPTRLTLS